MQKKRTLGRSALTIAPVVFGGNVFGWNLDARQSHALLDAFVDHGFDAIDTADVYSTWAPGNRGGESETIIGEWLKARPGMRERITLCTKVGSDMGGAERKGLSRRWILEAVEASLRRLQTDVIDLYFAHRPDAGTPLEETFAAFDSLVQAGKARVIGVSNFDADLLGRALALTGVPRVEVLQPEYNLMDRAGFEGPLQRLCVAKDVGVVTYFSLASGFLSGKYRGTADLGQSVRGGDVQQYLNPRGFAVLAALHAVAERHAAKPAEVALAWLLAQPGVTAPIASATKPEHVASFARAVDLVLTPADLETLNL
ncbi:aldo/keto reductase [Rhodobacter sp. SY28-1]|uniref:aldo/keto reductase n=1 Tax=Rhodobacter sp. SY28-1 TaxID=2562317 RepID=UPI0010C06616|nr:aldo/keto reductase [Rhodobacter sp. SY28-1]